VQLSAFQDLLREIRACTVCAKELPLGPKPILTAHSDARILIVGQAPGTRVHATGTPWNDASGDRLRTWLHVDRETFYNEEKFAIVPMGFCYPGKGSSGDLLGAHGGAGTGRRHGWRSFDLPPRPECAPLWHAKVLAHLPNIRLTLLVGAYAIKRYLWFAKISSLTELVRNTDFTKAAMLPIVHPSPRNTIWLKKNAWFESEVVPRLRRRVENVL